MQTTNNMLDRNVAIEFNNVGKQYRLGRVGTGTLSHDLNRWWQTSILGKEDPYLKIGEVNDRSTKGHSDYVWALKDINFKVEMGDVVGIIGKNGAGKSTLLKLLSHITAPSTGDIRYRGRIASLLEVGTGFHPEMTARENIYMNGSIMGMTRHEITRKLDEIVDFAGIERYLDTPVKRFSSGMTVRLGFAVAAFLEPEILVVDEVLAVGDAEFQKKAIGKMKDVSSTGGRTVLFVSHNMAAVRTLCNNGIVLKNGCIDYIGTADNCVSYYMEKNIDSLYAVSDTDNLVHASTLQREMEYLRVEMKNDPQCVGTLEPLEFELTFKRNNPKIEDCQFGVLAKGTNDMLVWANYSDVVKLPTEGDVFKVRVTIPHHNTPMGKYSVNFNISRFDYTANIRDFDVVYGAVTFEVNYVDTSHTKPFTLWPFSAGTSIHDSKAVLI